MGLVALTKSRNIFRCPIIMKVLILGLDQSGKTTIVSKLQKDCVPEAYVPTSGFNVTTISYNNIDFQFWDIGRQSKFKDLWHHYYQGTDAVIYVIDAGDPNRIEEARKELQSVMNHKMLKHTKLLIFVNKGDVSDAMTTLEVAEKLNLKECFKEYVYRVQGCVALTGEGLYEGLNWLHNEL